MTLAEACWHGVPHCRPSARSVATQLREWRRALPPPPTDDAPLQLSAQSHGDAADQNGDADDNDDDDATSDDADVAAFARDSEGSMESATATASDTECDDLADDSLRIVALKRASLILEAIDMNGDQ